MTAPELVLDEMDPRLRSLPDLNAPIVSIASKVVRDYVRAVLVEPAIKRQFGIGMGLITFKQAFVTKNGGNIGVEVIETEAPPGVQAKALHDIISIGVPSRVVGDDGPTKIMGVLVLGEIGMQEARSRAAQDRIADTGPPQLTTGYVPPPGYEVIVIEDDLSGEVPPASPDDPPSQPTPMLTKAQQLAANRRAKR